MSSWVDETHADRSKDAAGTRSSPVRDHQLRRPGPVGLEPVWDEADTRAAAGKKRRSTSRRPAETPAGPASHQPASAPVRSWLRARTARSSSSHRPRRAGAARAAASGSSSSASTGGPSISPRRPSSSSALSVGGRQASDDGPGTANAGSRVRPRSAHRNHGSSVWRTRRSPRTASGRPSRCT